MRFRSSSTYDSGSDDKTVVPTTDSTTQRVSNAIDASFRETTDGTTTMDVQESGDRGNPYTLDSENSHTFSSQQTGNSVTGGYSLSETFTDDGSLSKSGSEGAGSTYTLVEETDVDGSTVKTGNSITGDYSLTTTDTDQIETGLSVTAASSDFTLTQDERSRTKIGSEPTCSVSVGYLVS